MTATHAGRVRLKIGARVIEASTDLKLNAGQSLRLRVTETGRQLVLRTENLNDQAVRVREGVRSALPRQGLQANLLATAQSASRLPLPPVVSQALQSFVAQIPRAPTLTQAATLRQAILHSGTFLERSIAAGRTANLVHDWKNALLQLRERLVGLQGTQTQAVAGRGGPQAPPVPTAPVNPGSGPAASVPAQAVAGAAGQAVPATANAAGVSATTPVPPKAVLSPDQAPPLRQRAPIAQPVMTEARLPSDVNALVGKLLGQTDAALARVKLNQLASTPVEQSAQRLTWLLELPVRHDNGDVEVLPLTIERERAGSGSDAQQVWAVNLAFDLGGGDALRARIALRGDQVYTSFWTARETTRASVESHLDTLRQALENNRVRVGCLSCAVARQAAPGEATETLVETRA